MLKQTARSLLKNHVVPSGDSVLGHSTAATGGGRYRFQRAASRGLVWGSLLSACGLVGCDGISIEPSCPAELRVGETGPVAANEIDAGAIPSYLWEVHPPDAGTFVQSTAANTTFQALAEGEVVIRLTASDGLYQVISQCRTRISGVAGAAVSLTAAPNPAQVGETVRLTCTSVGENEAVAFSLLQVDGQVVELIEQAEGVATFVADDDDNRTFQCSGEDEAGVPGEAVLVTVTFIPPVDDNENDNVADNENLNDNVVDNQNDNVPDNDNTDDNENENTPDNENDNAVDNENENGRPPPRPS